MRRQRILLLEDDPASRQGVREHLAGAGFEVDEADTCRTGLERYEGGDFDAVITSPALPDGDAIQLLEAFKRPPPVPVIVLAGIESIDLAVKAVKRGADQILTKPVELPALELIVRHQIARERDRKRVLALQAARAARTSDPFLGSSAVILRLADEARRLAAGERPVLLIGEAGVGKGVLADWLHRHSPRAEEPYAELHGIGRTGDRELGDRFEITHRGTLFLDGIDDASPDMQERVFEVIERKRFRRTGEARAHRADVRILASTREPLGERVRAGRFRGELLATLGAATLAIPALRERAGDLSALTTHILNDIGRELGRGGMRLSPEAQAELAGYTWPGNLRELRNVLERAVLLAPSEVIKPSDLSYRATGDRDSAELDEASLTLEDVERRHIQRVLDAEQGRVERAAARLGIARSTLYDNLKRFGIKRAP